MERPSYIDKKTGRRRTRPATAKAKAQAQAQADALPSVTAVDVPPPPLTEYGLGNETAGPSTERERGGAGAGTSRAGQAETAAGAAGAARAAHTPGPSGMDRATSDARARESSQPPRAAQPEQPALPAYNYQRDEATYGTYFGERVNVEIPQAKKRGMSGPEHVAEFLEQIPHWCWVLILRESRPKDGLCRRCSGPTKNEADWRCVECFRDRDMCISCLREAHLNLPFHRVYWWTGRHYRGSWLREAGLALYLCPNTPNGVPCPYNKARHLDTILPRVPTGLVKRRAEKGKGRAQGAPQGGGLEGEGTRRPAGAAGAAGAAGTAGTAGAAPSFSTATTYVQGDPFTESISVSRAPRSQDAMDVDLLDEAAGWQEAEATPLPDNVTLEDNDVDSELHVLYALYDSLHDIEQPEPEEVEGGTDDGTHAPLDSETTQQGGADMDSPSNSGTDPRAHAAIPRYDLHGFAVMSLVHDNGVHGLGVNFCCCPDHPDEYEQLLMHGLFPASTKAPATAYDVASLEKALIESAECNVRTEQYWKKIARLTVPEDPDATVNKYQITTRVHREYRALREYTEFGFAHQDPVNRRDPGPGEMTYECIACPRVYNVPDNFENLPDEQKAFYFHAWSIDGNMKAEHTTSRRPDNNVPIHPGSGFFPNAEEFEKDTQYAKTDKSLPPEITQGTELCHRHTAAGGRAGKADPSKDIRGILSICCARHGILLRGGTVDIFFVENQAQADYALNLAMKLNLHPAISRRLIIGYDIWCQYGIHLLERFKQFPHLDLPSYLEELTGIVGAWHIFAHIRECFGRNSGIYVWGIGLIEMEILETLWSLLNMVTDSCRNMSRANREETINFTMNDINLKKVRKLIPATVQKYVKKLDTKASRAALLDTMDKTCSVTSRHQWQQQLSVVYRKRSIDLENPQAFDPKFMDEFLQSAFVAPDRHAVEAELLVRETSDSEEPGLVKLIMNGLQIQIEQLSWQAYEKNNSPLTQVTRKKLTAARSDLKSRITKHNKLAAELMGPRILLENQPVHDPLFGKGVRLQDLTKVNEWRTESSADAERGSSRQPEFYGIDLPSSRPMPLNTPDLARAGAYEIVLRHAWKAHLLHEICESLVVQVEIFRRTIRRTPGGRHMSQSERAKVSSNMREQYQSVRVYAQQYNVFHARMNDIQPTPTLAEKYPEYSADSMVQRAEYKPLSPQDIRCDTKAYDTQGTGDFRLPWFWKLTARRKDISDDTFVQEFFRVRWINARALLDRSEEEIGVLHAEMGMIYKGYRKMAGDWEMRARLMEGVEDGNAHAAHAWEKNEIWLEFADRARQEFNRVVPGIIA